MELRWEKRFIAGEAFESAHFVDIDGDGVLDIASGGFWYQGPDFELRHSIAEVPRFGDYYDDFGAVAMDITGDGRPDLVTGGWWGGALRWRENPVDGSDRWVEHHIADTGPIEQPSAWDVDGDGQLELVPNTPSDPLRVFSHDGTTWQERLLWAGAQGHGLGFGDISGSGRGDFVMNHGWLEAPPDAYAGGGADWIYHPEFDLGPTASVPILVVDVDGDGLSDLIVGNGHGYGLDWWRQGRDAAGARTWTKHEIDPSVSQCHTLRWVDIDGDGRPELVTGKRWRAHPQGDAGNGDDLGIWYYRWTGERFEKHTIDAGPAGYGSGIGIDFDVRDVTGNGYPDLVAPGKDGLWLFLNRGPTN